MSSAKTKAILSLGSLPTGLIGAAIVSLLAVFGLVFHDVNLMNSIANGHNDVNALQGLFLNTHDRALMTTLLTVIAVLLAILVPLGFAAWFCKQVIKANRKQTYYH